MIWDDGHEWRVDRALKGVGPDPFQGRLLSSHTPRETEIRNRFVLETSLHVQFVVCGSFNANVSYASIKYVQYHNGEQEWSGNEDIVVHFNAFSGNFPLGFDKTDEKYHNSGASVETQNQVPPK
jgi:hypothetical protein